MSASVPTVDRIRIIPRPDEFLDRNVGSSGELFFSRDSNSLRVYSGKDRGGFEVARADLDNVSNSAFATKAAEAGIGGGGSGSGASISVSETAPTSPDPGNLWLNTNNGYLYVYINDGSSSQWIQPAVPPSPLPTLATVAFTGNYNDLSNKPQFAEVFSGSYNDLTDTPILFSGSYNDLTDKPTLFSGSYNDLTDTPTTFSNLVLTGLTTLQQSAEVLNLKTSATGIVEHDFSTGAIFYHSSISANFTANFTNVPTTNNRATSVVLVLNQGATARVPTTIQINGVTQTVKWQGGVSPTGTSGGVDLLSLTFFRVASAWNVTGSITAYQ